MQLSRLLLLIGGATVGSCLVLEEQSPPLSRLLMARAISGRRKAHEAEKPPPDPARKDIMNKPLRPELPRSNSAPARNPDPSAKHLFVAEENARLVRWKIRAREKKIDEQIKMKKTEAAGQPQSSTAPGSAVHPEIARLRKETMDIKAETRNLQISTLEQTKQLGRAPLIGAYHDTALAANNAGRRDRFVRNMAKADGVMTGMQASMIGSSSVSAAMKLAASSRLSPSERDKDAARLQSDHSRQSVNAMASSALAGIARNNGGRATDSDSD